MSVHREIAFEAAIEQSLLDWASNDCTLGRWLTRLDE
jgi:hypothetical protein